METKMYSQEQKIFELLQSHRNQVNLSRFPNFLVLGPQCTGTSWLHVNLSQHPEIFMPTRKELIFFTRSHLAKFIGRENEFDLKNYMSFFKQSIWTRRFSPKATVMGEASSSYAWQPLEVIKGIACLNPKLKGIMLVRDPVDKVWSNLRRKMVNEKGYTNASHVPDGEIQEFIQDPHQINSAMFSKMIENWSQNLGEDNLFVGAFSDLAERPAELLLDLFRFLEVSPEQEYLTENMNKKIRVGEKSPLPDRWRAHLEGVFQEERERLLELYGYKFPN